MGTGQEITIQLALRQKPMAFGIRNHFESEVIPDALNAVRLLGHSQILVLGSCSAPSLWFLDTDEPIVAKTCEIIAAMQLKGEKIEITTTPNTPEERDKTGFCRIDLHLKK